MPRTYKSKNVQTKPELAGEKNMPEEYLEKNKKDGNGEVLNKVAPLFKQARAKRGTNWKADDLFDAIEEFFAYCAENDIKVYKGGLALWLGCSKGQIWEWETKPQKYGEVSEIIRLATTVIEGQYIGRAEQFPTANLFLLRSSHGHVETSKVDVTTTSNASDVEEVNELVSKLGLDKEK